MASPNLTMPKELKPFLKLGTSSWKYDSWQGLLYPPGTKDTPGSYLAEYAKHLGTVEVDQWFWSLFPSGVKLPDPSTAKAYAESVPDDFLFAIKAPNALTLTHFYSHQPKRYADYANQPNRHFLSVAEVHSDAVAVSVFLGNPSAVRSQTRQAALQTFANSSCLFSCLTSSHVCSFQS